MCARVGVIGFCILLVLTGCAPTNEPEYEPPDVYGNGIVVSDTIVGQPFTVVDVWDGCTTTIVQDSVCRAIVSADENLLGHGIGTSVRAHITSLTRTFIFPRCRIFSSATARIARMRCSSGGWE